MSAPQSLMAGMGQVFPWRVEYSDEEAADFRAAERAVELAGKELDPDHRWQLDRDRPIDTFEAGVLELRGRVLHDLMLPNGTRLRIALVQGPERIERVAPRAVEDPPLRDLRRLRDTQRDARSKNMDATPRNLRAARKLSCPKWVGWGHVADAFEASFRVIGKRRGWKIIGQVRAADARSAMHIFSMRDWVAYLSWVEAQETTEIEGGLASQEVSA